MAYFARAVSYSCNMFIKSTLGVGVIKTFSLSLKIRKNKLGCFFRIVLIFVSKAGARPSGASRGLTLRVDSRLHSQIID